MAKRQARIAVVGSANVDLTSFTDHFPKPGETVFGDSFDLGFGGKGANQAVAAKYCGAKVQMVARVGDDLFGPATIQNFKSLGIGARHVKTVKGVASGVAPIFVDKSGQNRIGVVKGANDKLTARGVSQAASRLKRADVIILQFEIPLATVYHTVRFAHKNKIRCIVNPAPAAPVDLKELANVDYFIPSYQVEPKDTTGAGDAFIGSFAVFLAEGMPERDALARANLYAALSTTSVGTQKSFLQRRAFERQWKKINKT